MRWLGVAAPLLLGCASANRVDEPPQAAGSDAGGDAGTVAHRANGVAPDATAPDAAPKTIRVFVPFRDCARNDIASGVAVEGCECAAPDGTICCIDGATFECTGYGWRAAVSDECIPNGVGDPARPDAGWDPSQPAQCHACERGTAGCWCRADTTCNTGLLCVEDLCGMPAD